MTRIAPQKSNSYLYFIFLLVGFLTVSYLTNGFWQGWEPGNSIVMLGVFLLVVPLSFQLAAKLSFGDIIEFTDDQLKISSKGKEDRVFSWSDLKYYGDGNGFYMIQFGDEAAMQLSSGSYSNEDWAKLTNFLTTRFPDCQADGYFGAHLFKTKK